MGVCADPGSLRWCQALSRSTCPSSLGTTHPAALQGAQRRHRHRHRDQQTPQTTHRPLAASTTRQQQRKSNLHDAQRLRRGKQRNCQDQRKASAAGHAGKDGSNNDNPEKDDKTAAPNTEPAAAAAAATTVTATPLSGGCGGATTNENDANSSNSIRISPTNRLKGYSAAISIAAEAQQRPSLSNHRQQQQHRHRRQQLAHGQEHHRCGQEGRLQRLANNGGIIAALRSHVKLQKLIIFVLFLLLRSSAVVGNLNSNIPEDAVHITAILGEGVIFNCHVEFPNDHPVPYVLQWDKKGSDLPIYIWYESYPEHIEEGYKGRVSRVSQDSPFGSASLNLTNIKESDQGWYECKVVFLNRDPKQHKNGTWFHLDVHAPPRFSVTPEDIIYVNLGDSIILNCQADGTPTPEILWYKDANPVDPSPTVGIFNDGTELRISTIRHEDIGEYTCIARNGEGQVSHTARVIIAGGAVIMPTNGPNSKTLKTDENQVLPKSEHSGLTVPPTNQTKLEGDKVIFSCEAKAMPGNVTVRWFREGSPVREVASLETRVTIRKDGSLIINPVSADDSGQYLCEVTNGIGDPQSASAYLNVEYPAKVTFTPTVQYLPFRLAGVVQCYIKSSPQLLYVTWTKDKRLLEPYQMKDIVVMANGSLLFTRVSEDHQGRYTCTPYNAQGTQGSSGPMEVLVRKPPTFTVEPESLYQRKVGDSVEMHCDAVEAEGTQRPTIKWQRQEGEQLSESQRSRVKVSGGNITIENLRREDFGYYQCVVSNEVATLMSVTQLVIEGTQPHAPYNITGKATESSITLQWMPGYSGGSEYKQDYTIWYREAGVNDWQTISVTPSGSTQVTINGLASGTTYEFQVVGRNVLGDGMMSKVMTVRTLEDAPAAPRNVKAATQPPDHVFQLMPDEAGPKPGPPRNLTVTEVSNGFLISWQAPLERAHIVKFYTIKYRTDAQWKTLNRGQIRPEETQYLVKNLVGGRTYYFRVLANSEKSYESSDEVKFPVPARVKHKAITAGVVGGILFFIVAIILSVCAVKICNKRKRRKQEKEFNMVACRITDARNIAAVNNTHLRSHSTGSISAGQVPLKNSPPRSSAGSPTDGGAVQRRSLDVLRLDGGDLLTAAEKRRRPLHTAIAGIHGDEDEVGPVVPAAAIAVLSEGKGGNEAGENRRHSSASQNSSSDDGGFLSRRSFITARASWRRPLVASPSQLSLQSAAGSARGFLQGLGGLLKVGADIVDEANAGARYQNLPLFPQQGAYRNSHGLADGQLLHHACQPLSSRPLHINTVSGGLAVAGGVSTAAAAPGGYHSLYTPSRLSRFYASSPAASPGELAFDFANSRLGAAPHQTADFGHLLGDGAALPLSPPWAPLTPNGSQHYHFSDLSTVYPSSAERSLPTPTATGNLSRYSRYYAHELPSLRTIQEETRRMYQQQQQQQQRQQEYEQQLHDHDQLDADDVEAEHEELVDNLQDLSPHGFVPLQIPSPPSWRNYYQQHYPGGGGGGVHQALAPYHSYRPRTRWYPRHYSRLFGRAQSELLSPLPHLNLSLRSASAIGASGGMGLEASPESRSSSSGFGSKNNSNHPHGSHHSGSMSEWRLLPPYRPPPPPPANGDAPLPGAGIAAGSAYFGSPHAATVAGPTASMPPAHYSNYYGSLGRPITPPYTMEHWLEMISRLNAATDHVDLPKSVDVGSVDGHYEFDPSTPTPSASTPTVGLLRDDLNLHIDTSGGHHHSHPLQHHHHHHQHDHHPHSHSLSQLRHSQLHAAHAATLLGGDPLSESNFYALSEGRGGGGGGVHPLPPPPGSASAASQSLRLAGFDTTEARLQVMKDEFYAFRKRQAMKRAGVTELESVC